ncbi:hypothetical protein M9H77_04600 [Catharanthus roseus]|uniref:Uncharacterized protein n=1 Tax=Catharanthus roseus TaxID=4058 RepID=A0ACC0CER8_CATRO|nr:hypothetical protein M9H77_04600 [Catharanthus roseus]
MPKNWDIYMDVAHCNLDGNADAVEFCPHHSFEHVLAASTYTLQEGDKPSRRGSISLFYVDAQAGQFGLNYQIETAGIFDIKWSPVGGNAGPLLAQADADGCLKIHELKRRVAESASHENYLEEVCGEHISSSMCLCLDWNQSSTSINVGLSDGSVSIVSLVESQLSILREWKAHEFELWATSFDIHQPNLVYTGSDDCKFSCWDLREDPSNIVFQNSKVHKMGVCCIAKNPNDSNVLLTGSYDEYLRIWDMRSISQPVSKSSLCLGGGVWRIKYHPTIPDLVLTACMHNGFAIVKTKNGEAESIEAYNNKHGSLAYGADWQREKIHKQGKQGNSVVATCSFYDRLLRVWIPKSDIFE